MNRNRKVFVSIAIVVGLMPVMAMAVTSGGSSSSGLEFKAVYDFVNQAATGYLGRSISIVGGLIGLGVGAAMGKALPAITGVILAIFGSLGPKIIDTIFSTALI